MQDRRVQRTRTLLTRALMELIVEKGYQAITVQDIIDRANLGRSTFYAHFLDKEDLLMSGLEEVVHQLIQGMKSGPQTQYKASQKGSVFSPSPRSSSVHARKLPA